MSIDEHVKKEAEGNLFRSRDVMGGLRDTVSFMEHFYVCRNGICYSVHPETMKEYPTGDPLIDLVSQCEHLGEFETNKHLIVRTEFRDVTREQLYKFFLPRKKRSGTKV